MIHNEFEIRRAVPDDTNAIYAMHQQLAEQTGFDMSQFALGAFNIRLMLQEQQRREGDASHPARLSRLGPHVFIAHSSAHEEAAGVVVASLMHPYAWSGVRPMYVEDLITVPRHRGRGVGAMLLGAVSNEALAATRDAWGNLRPDLANVRLSTHAAQNDETRSFYERLGFATDSVEYRAKGATLVELASRTQCL